MKFCEKCGSELSGENFCSVCGNKIEPETENQTVTEVADVAPVKENNLNVNNGVNIKNIPKKFLIIAVAAVAIVIAIIVIITSNSGHNFKKLYEDYCISTWAEVGSDGSYLSIDTNPSDLEDNGIAYIEAYYAIEVINEELGLPSSLFEEMGSTTGADGKQVEEFEEVTVSWKYHPDSGMEVIYKKK